MESIRDCKKIQSRLSEYVDGALSGDETWQARTHLATCAVCARVADDLAATARLLQTLPAPGPSERFEAKLAQRLADQALRPRPTFLARLADGWSRPRVRSATLTSGLALAALLPLTVVALRASRPQTAPAVLAETETMDQLWKEHATFASSEPLSDPSNVLLADLPAGRGGAGL